MESLTIIFRLLYIISIAVNIGLLYWSYSRELGRTGEIFSFSVIMMTGWTLFGTISVLSPDISFSFAAWHVTYIFIWGTAVGWFIFALYYTGYGNYVTRNRLIITVILVISFIILSQTNPEHNIIWSDYQVIEGTNIITATPTIIFYALLIFGYSLTLGTALILLITMIKSERVTKQQTLLIGLSFIIATIIHAIDSIFLFNEPVRIDILAVTIIGLALAYTLMKKDLLTLEPITRTDVLSSINEGIIVTTEQGKVIDYNRVTEEIFPEIEGNIGEQVQDIVPEITVKNDGETIEFKDKVEIEDQETGESMKYVIDKVPVMTESGNRLRGFTITLRDITELERYAADLERQTEQLEEFTSFVSHDMRNPITVAQTYLYDLENDYTDERIDISIDSLERVNEMIEDSLTLARQGKAIQERKIESLSGIVEDAWKTTESKDASIQINIDSNKTVYADDSRLQTLFENLFRNSIEHGGSDVTVTAGLLEGNQGFYIEDDGPGIPEEERTEVFTKGFTTNTDGTGFGLAIVSNIVDAHNWYINVSESESGGARFEITNVDSIVENTIKEKH